MSKPEVDSLGWPMLTESDKAALEAAGYVVQLSVTGSQIACTQRFDERLGRVVAWDCRWAYRVLDEVLAPQGGSPVWRSSPHYLKPQKRKS